MELIIHLLGKLCSPCRILGVLESQMDWLLVAELLQAGSTSGQRPAEPRDAGAGARDAGAEPGVTQERSFHRHRRALWCRQPPLACASDFGSSSGETRGSSCVMGTRAVKDVEPVHLLLQKQSVFEGGQALIITRCSLAQGSLLCSPLEHLTHCWMVWEAGGSTTEPFLFAKHFIPLS